MSLASPSRLGNFRGCSHRDHRGDIWPERNQGRLGSWNFRLTATKARLTSLESTGTLRRPALLFAYAGRDVPELAGAYPGACKPQLGAWPFESSARSLRRSDQSEAARCFVAGSGGLPRGSSRGRQFEAVGRQALACDPWASIRSSARTSARRSAISSSASLVLGATERTFRGVFRRPRKGRDQCLVEDLIDGGNPVGGPGFRLSGSSSSLAAPPSRAHRFSLATPCRTKLAPVWEVLSE